jgi:predicted nucleic acid-binding Zn ribbon protein
MSDDNIRKISDVFNDLLKSQGLDDKIRKAKVIAHWNDIVGPSVARHTYNLHFDNKKLIVHVKSESLKNDLNFMKNQIIQNIHQTIKEQFIEDIIFV